MSLRPKRAKRRQLGIFHQKVFIHFSRRIIWVVVAQWKQGWGRGVGAGSVRGGGLPYMLCLYLCLVLLVDFQPFQGFKTQKHIIWT